MKRRVYAFSGCLGAAILGGCVMMPPAPYGRVLLKGQNETSSGMDAAYRPDTLRTSTESSTGTSSQQSQPVSQWAEFAPLFCYWGRNYGISAAGTEWGWQVTPLSLEPAAFLRQALVRPVDPSATSLALQFDGVWGVPSYGSLDATLAATKGFGSWFESTLALRGGWTRYPLWGDSNGGWGPVSLGTVEILYTDLVLSLGFHNGSGRANLELVGRLPASGSVPISDSTYTQSYAPYTVIHDSSEAVLAPSIFVALRSSIPDFTSYAAQALVLPRRWFVRPSPDAIPAADHLRLAAELAQAGMPADAADEYQEALREDPTLDQAQLPLALLYLDLKEPELARYHAQRAIQEGDHSKAAQDALQSAEQALKTNP